jgi:hypothetical protein
MKKLLYTGILIVISIFCSAIISAEEKSYPLKDFTEIHFSMPGSVFVTQSDEYRVVVEGTRDQIEDIVIQQIGNSLVIEQEWSFLGLGEVDVESVVIHVGIPRLETIQVSSKGAIHGLSTFNKAKKMTIESSSSGNIYMTIDVDEIEARVSSSGSITLKGMAASAILKTSSSGDVGFAGTITEYLQATTSSFGKITCELSPEVEVPRSELKISSFGDIEMTGLGDYVQAKSSSAGNFLLSEFSSNNMKIDLSSSGNAYINTTGYLDLKTSSSGRIVNQGSPRMN